MMQSLTYHHLAVFIMNKILDVYPLLDKDELEQVTGILLEACSRNDKSFTVFETVLLILNHDND